MSYSIVARPALFEVVSLTPAGAIGLRAAEKVEPLDGSAGSWHRHELKEIAVKPGSAQFSFKDRAAKKAAARARDEAALQAGAISSDKLARLNGGGVRQVRYIGPSARIRRLAASWRYARKLVMLDQAAA